MRKIMVVLGVILLSLSMVACSSGNTDANKGSDKEFIKDIKKSFEARSKYLEKVDETKVAENEFLKEAVLTEKKILEKYKDVEFDSPELGKLAKDYIQGLNDQEESLKYYSKDFMKYEEIWSRGYDTRSTVLTTLIEKFGLEISDKAIQELKDNAQVVKEKNDIDKKVDEMLKNIKFDKVKDEYDWKDYEAVVQNTSGVDLEGFYLDVKLIDAEGVIVESNPVFVDGIWTKDKKVKLTFSTDKDFEKLEWTAEYSIKE